MHKNFIPLALFLSFLLSLKISAHYQIYPIPQEQKDFSSIVILGDKINFVCENDIDSLTKLRTKNIFEGVGKSVVFSNVESSSSFNVYLGINGSSDLADSKAESLSIDRSVFSVENKYDRHLISITKDGIIVLGDNSDGIFYAMASLQQIFEQGSDTLFCEQINDYADQQYRGIVEGYYGYPYPVEVKKDLMNFMMRFKMNTYLYGAKSDPYHSGYWRNAYPSSITSEQKDRGWLSQNMISDLCKTSQATKVNFIWAIHPGSSNAVSFSSDASTTQGVNDVFSKYQKMYDLGVRQFAVFIDDVGCNMDQVDNYATFLTKLENKLEDTYNKVGTNSIDTVKPLHYVPHIYALGFANEENRTKYFNAIATTPSQIVVYTTGWGVWSVPNNSDLKVMNGLMGRNVAWWWNYPCNDNADARIYTSDMCTNFVEAPSIGNNSRLSENLQNCVAIVSNPMQEGEIAKIPLFSVADYAWNNEAFNNEDSWNASFNATISEKYKDDYKFLSHYLKYYDNNLSSLIDTYKNEIKEGNVASSTLIECLNKIIDSATHLQELEKSKLDSDSLLYSELKPWLLKLKGMAKTAKTFISIKKQSDIKEKWNVFLEAKSLLNDLNVNEDYQVSSLEGMGENPPVAHRVAEPSQKNLMPFITEMLQSSFNTYLKRENDITSPTVISNTSSVSGSIINGDRVSASFRGILESGKYVGIVLPKITKVDSFLVKGDVLESFDALYSVDGKQWMKYAKDKIQNNYVKYFAFFNSTEESKKIQLHARNFNIYIPHKTVIVDAILPSETVWDGHTKNLIIDGDYTTFVTLNRNQINGDKYTVKLKEMMPINDIRICMGTVNGDYMNKAYVEISSDNYTWTPIYIKGTMNKNFTMSNKAVVKYSDEMSYCDFESFGIKAQYVRLNVVDANTSKWLRLYEIEVNKISDKKNYSPIISEDNITELENLIDGKATTSFIPSDEEGSMIYHFINIEKLKSISIFFDDKILKSGAEVKVSFSNDGSVWNNEVKLTDGYTSLDCTTFSSVSMMRITWEGGTPEFCELSEHLSTENVTITFITRVMNANNDSSINVKVHNNKLLVNSVENLKDVFIYTLSGKLLMEKHYSNNLKNTIFSLNTFNEKIYLLSISTSNGNENQFKIYR